MDEALHSLPADAPEQQRRAHYEEIIARIQAMLDGENDWIAAMATVACELYHAFDYYNWTGFYRAVGDNSLAIGPYQGTHGCLRVDYSRGVCGAAAREQKTQLVPNVHAFPGHIACSTSTNSEIVAPIVTPQGRLLAVLDVDSDLRAAFNEADRKYLEKLCDYLGEKYRTAI